MTRDEIIKGLDECANNRLSCGDCPYIGTKECFNVVMRDAIVLLKAQEPVEPVRKPEIFDSLYFCGKCLTKVGFQIRKDDSWRFKCNFCPNCGMAVKWE